ncbi:hypothetical protein [Dyella sp. 2RAB6]|uniref:hypothetical protein n=1 Tax=Dyella sp. 2RAB6 TaxID=3232992 RepID=UPI003F9281F7
MQMNNQKEEKPSLVDKLGKWAALAPTIALIVGGATGHLWTVAENESLKSTNAQLRQDIKDRIQELANERDARQQARNEAATAEAELSKLRISIAQANGTLTAIPGLQQQLSNCQASVATLKGNAAEFDYIQGLQRNIQSLDGDIHNALTSTIGNRDAIIQDYRMQRQGLQDRIMDAQSRLRYAGPYQESRSPIIQTWQ